MDAAEQLEILQQAQGDPALLALASVDLTLPELGQQERLALQVALEAAAVPHWCDASMLAALLDIDSETAAHRWAMLRRIPIIEAFPARGSDAGNVHEASRLALRRRLASSDRDALTTYSSRVANYLLVDARPIAAIERVCHRLVADPDGGTAELANLWRRWSAEGYPEDRAALMSALGELLESGLVRGRAEIRSRVVIADQQANTDGDASLGEEPDNLLRAAAKHDDAGLVADIHCLRGQVSRGKGDLRAAETAFDQARDILQRLVDRDPSNAGWQRSLAVAHSRVGDVAQARGDLNAAETALDQARDILQRLVDRDPSNAGWQRSLAVAHARVGDLAQARGDLNAPETAFDQARGILQRLVDRDPSNAGWQRDLAVAHARAGDLAQARGDLNAAETAFDQARDILQRLVDRDPSNAGWQRDLASVQQHPGLPNSQCKRQ
jgi:tetratricopeptide (TPR) repeat protein